MSEPQTDPKPDTLLRPRMLIISDSPSATTGLGGQAQLLVEAGLRAGFDVAVCAMNAGEEPRLPPREGRTPGGVRQYIVGCPPAASQLLWAVLREQPSIIVGLADFWMLVALRDALPDTWHERVIMWVNQDCDHYDRDAESFYKACGAVVMTSRFGERVNEPLRRAGGRLEVIHHAVKPDLLLPDDVGAIRKIREASGTVGQFVALHVGRNQMRKNHPHLIDGWAKFVRGLDRDDPTGDDRKRVRLYLHTEERVGPLTDVDPQMAAFRSIQIGHNLPVLIDRLYPDVKDTIRFSERDVRDADLRLLYRFSDVCVNVAQGEGFGLINVEAPACGRAIIAADNTTTRELVGGEGAEHDDHCAVRPAGDGDALAPFGYRVPCDAWMLQPDILARRWFPNTDLLAEAFQDAFERWSATDVPGAVFNGPAVEARRRQWTLERHGWEVSRDKWVTLLKDVHAKNTQTRGSGSTRVRGT